jgi:hypothetical protein
MCRLSFIHQGSSDGKQGITGNVAQTIPEFFLVPSADTDNVPPGIVFGSVRM